MRPMNCYSGEMREEKMCSVDSGHRSDYRNHITAIHATFNASQQRNTRNNCLCTRFAILAIKIAGKCGAHSSISSAIQRLPRHVSQLTAVRKLSKSHLANLHVTINQSSDKMVMVWLFHEVKVNSKYFNKY